MPQFGKKSLERLATLHPDLQRVLNRAIVRFDFAITCGLRGKIDQDAAYKGGFSKVQWPDSRHNCSIGPDKVCDFNKSDAVDLAPLPIDWNNRKAFENLATIIKACAVLEGVQIRWGGNWAKFPDIPHFERVV